MRKARRHAMGCLVNKQMKEMSMIFLLKPTMTSSK